MKKSTIEQLVSTSILFAISSITILPFLFKTTPVLVDDEKDFKMLLHNLTSNVEFHSENNILPALLFLPLSFNAEVSDFLISDQISINYSHLTFLRLVPAILSSLVAPFFFNFLYYQGTSLRTAFILSLFLPLDSSFIIRSRLFLPDCFIYFFSVVSLFFFSAAFKYNSFSCYMISAFSSSISFLCDHQGLYIVSYIFFRLVDLSLKQKMKFYPFFLYVLYLFANLIICFCFIAIIHIGLQSGPSDIQPLYTRFASETADMISLNSDIGISFDSNFSLISKFSFPKVTNDIKIIPNFMMFLIFLTGIFASIRYKKPNSISHFFLAFFSSFFYKDTLINHIQIMIIFGLISASPFFDITIKNQSQLVSYIIMFVSLITYLFSFQSIYGGRLSFQVLDHEL